MSLQKRKPIKSKKVRDSARGEACTMGTAVCNHDDTTTVLCHLPDASGTGKMAGKTDDVGAAVYACSRCHDLMDGRMSPKEGAYNWYELKEFYMLRALKRTIRRMIENGTIEIK